MVPLTESEKSEIIRLLSTGQPLPEQWRYRLFPKGHRAQETDKEYRSYAGWRSGLMQELDA